MRQVLTTLLLAALVALFAYSVWVNPDTVSPTGEGGYHPTHMSRNLQP
jgi:hypothetical protein